MKPKKLSVDLVELLGQVAEADQVAFESLYIATRAKLFGVILRIVYNHDDAAEILQEVYVRIWNRAGHFMADRGAPMAWMISIARNRALDWRRKANTEIATDAAPGLDDQADDSPGPLEQAITSSRARHLAECLGELEKLQQQCVILAYREGLSHQELAERFDRPLGTIKSWIRRSLTRLKVCLER